MPQPRSRDWAPWTIRLPTTLAVVVAVLLGTVGWFGVAFAIGSDCTDKFSCGSGSCAACATAHAWVTAGGIGQWVLAAAAIALLMLGLRQPHWRRVAGPAAWAIAPLACAFLAVCAILAAHSY